MRPLQVVVRDELAEDRPKMLLVEDDEMVQAFAAQGADEPFADRVGTRARYGRGNGVDPNASGALAEVVPIDRIPVAEQMARLLSPRRRFDHLAPHPGRGRVRGHVDM